MKTTIIAIVLFLSTGVASAQKISRPIDSAMIATPGALNRTIARALFVTTARIDSIPLVQLGVDSVDVTAAADSVDVTLPIAYGDAQFFAWACPTDLSPHEASFIAFCRPLTASTFRFYMNVSAGKVLYFAWVTIGARP
jgi:hypothetical protein